MRGLFDPRAQGELPCDLCDESGYAIVPHIQHIIDGAWLPYMGTDWKATFAVACRCPKGVAISSSERHPMSLDKYESLNPAWKFQLAEYQRDFKARQEEIRLARRADTSVDPEVQRMMAAWGV